MNDTIPAPNRTAMNSTARLTVIFWGDVFISSFSFDFFRGRNVRSAVVSETVIGRT